MIDADFIIYKRVSYWSGALALLIGVVVLIGWAAQIPILTTLHYAWVSMKVNTAIGFLLLGSAIFITLTSQSATNPTAYHWAARICAIALVLIGGSTLIEYVFGIDLHIDQLVLLQKTGKALDDSTHGRMSPFTAVMQVNYGIALLLLNRGKKSVSAITTAQCFAFTGGAIGILAFIGYLLNAKELYAVGHSTAIAVHTALGFIIVSAGILFLEPESALMRTFTGRTITGQVLRRLVPLALCLPVLVGWLRLRGQQIGLYGFEAGLAIMVTSSVIICELGIFWITRKFQEVELALSQREEQLREQAELLNLTNDAVMVRALDGKIIFWNKGAERMYGYSSVEAVGKISHDILQTQFPIGLEDIQSVVLRTGRWEGELIHHTKSQEPITVASRWSKKTDDTGRPVAILEINNDIRQAKEAEGRVNEFYSTVSHELRTPLTSIRGVFGLFEGGKAGELSDRAKHLVTIGLKETERLIRLINDILDIKKLEAGKLDLYLETVEPRQLVEETIASVTGFAIQHQVQLIADISDNELIYGDKDRLVQILTNLISNAIKFSDAGQAVQVVTSSGEKSVRFSIIDKGPGIDPRNVPKLFRMFEQVRGGAKGGTGLGLAICKSLVEQHNGSIGIDTELGKGSTFWFEIPCA